jgi:SAM-dependent methyltransferase
MHGWSRPLNEAEEKGLETFEMLQRELALHAYERRIGRWSRLAAEQLLAWLDWPAGGRWLDVGAGTGALAAAIADRCAPQLLVGLDASAANLRYGRAHGFDGGAALVVADAAALPFRSTVFDGVLSALVLNQLRDPALAVAEMARVARAGGTVAAYVWDFAEAMQPLRLFWDAAIALDPAAADHDQARKYPLCRLERLAALFASCGLRGIATRALDVAADFDSFADLWDPLVTGDSPLAEYAGSLPRKHLLALRARLRENARPASDGRIRLVARALAVRGCAGDRVALAG